MQVEVVVPQIGEAVSELTLVGWLKDVGDVVQKGDVLFEVDSDKAIVEVEAFVNGKLIEIHSPAGSGVMPQQIVALIETSDETPTPVEKDAATENERQVSPVARRVAKELGVDLGQIDGSGPRGRIIAEDVYEFAHSNDQRVPESSPSSVRQRVNASPKAKRLAREWNVDLRQLVGTGTNGMIRAKDVEAARATATDQTQTVHPLSKLRQTVATRTLQSKREVPHFYLMVDVNMTQVNTLRSYCVTSQGWQRPPTYTAILIRACALALKQLAWANRTYTEAGLVEREEINIGVAVDTPEGLIVPVIAGADGLSLHQTAEALQGVAKRAQGGHLKLSDMGEKSITISNLGMYSVDQFIAIIDIPDPMILAAGRVVDRVIPVDGQIAVQPMCTLTLSVDHRVLDGVQGAKFLERVKDTLENPFAILG